ncbi:MAG TPA: hypothetical protein VFR23_01000 [Jiangellaceae bacterium]|nr:hypothetical protein [Jiangellaceae bacterium]
MTTTTDPATVGPRPAAALGAGRAGYREALWSEWTKFATLRSTRVLAAGLGAALPVFAVVVAATGSLQSDDTILGASLLGGAVLAQVLAAVLGAGLITGEFKTGMIRVTLAACPRRLVVLAAKATVAAGVVFAVTLVSAAAAFGIGLVMLDGDSYATGDAWPALIGVALAISSIAVLGLGIGTVVRHPAGAVTAAIGVVLLPGLLAPLLGDSQRWLGGASLNGVMQKLTESSDATPETVGSLGAWPSLGVVAVYTVAAVLAAVRVLRHRDT